MQDTDVEGNIVSMVLIGRFVFGGGRRYILYQQYEILV